MAHIAYPSTPNFKNFRTDYRRALNWERPAGTDASEELQDIDGDPTSRLRPPRRATFFGTVKLHGTNATIVFRNSIKGAQIQSRSWIIEDAKKDNCGTYALLSKVPLDSLVDQILAVRGQGPCFREIYIAGEVAGRGVQKGVAITEMERFFAIFNIRIDDRWVDMRQYKSCSLPEHRVFNLAQYKTYEVDIDFEAPTDEVQALMEKYTTEVYEACPFGAAFIDTAGRPIAGRGEGIVWTMVPSTYLDEADGRGLDSTLLTNFKTKGESFSTTSRAPKEQKSVDPATATLVAQFAEFALGERRFEQGIEHLEGEQARQGLEKNGYDVKLTGAFIKWVTDDAIKEEKNEMKRLGVSEKDARKEVSGRAREWYNRRCKEIPDRV